MPWERCWEPWSRKIERQRRKTEEKQAKSVEGLRRRLDILIPALSLPGSRSSSPAFILDVNHPYLQLPALGSRHKHAASGLGKGVMLGFRPPWKSGADSPRNKGKWDTGKNQVSAGSQSPWLMHGVRGLSQNQSGGEEKRQNAAGGWGWFFFNLSQSINNSRNFRLILGVSKMVIVGKGSQVYGDKRGKLQKKNYRIISPFHSHLIYRLIPCHHFLA